LAEIGPSISVVSCCYTEARWNDLLRAIESVQRQTCAPTEILLIVDHNPALYDVLRGRYDAKDVTVLENSHTRGLSGARNTGIAAARGEVVAFLDDDAAADPDWLACLVAPYANPRVLGVGGFIDPDWSSAPPRWFPSEFRCVVGCSYSGLPKHGGPVRNLIGANMSFRRLVFDRVGSFRSELGHNGHRPGGDEETELCIRINREWPESLLLYEPRARVKHHVPAARATWAYFRARCFAEGMNKARVARFVGAGAGLASERRYTMATLPSGMLRALVSGQPIRAAAIAAGLAVTIAGYAQESLRK